MLKLQWLTMAMRVRFQRHQGAGGLCWPIRPCVSQCRIIQVLCTTYDGLPTHTLSGRDTYWQITTLLQRYLPDLGDFCMDTTALAERIQFRLCVIAEYIVVHGYGLVEILPLIV